MKRVLALLSLVCALFVTSACHYDVNLSVEADAELLYLNGPSVRVGPSFFEGFHHKNLTDNDLERIFLELTRNVSPEFSSAFLHLEIYDEISGKPLRDETYGVVYDNRSGHYDFAEIYD